MKHWGFVFVTINRNKISKFLLLITLKIKATTVDSHSQVLKDV